jgi:copper chaperone
MTPNNFELQVSGMSCGHCVKAVTAALQAQDSQAQVQVDLQTQQVKVQTTQAREAVVLALDEAGYPVS